jgi:molybdate transport system permease protein
MDWQAVTLTLRLAATTTILLMSVALPLAHWLARRPSGLRAVVQALVALPLVLPVGRVLIRIVGHPLAFTFEGLVVGSMLYSLPFAVQPMAAGFAAVDREYAEAASTLGASPWRIFWGITLPLARRSVLTAAVLAFTHTVGEFGVVLMLGGNIPGATRTLSIALYDQVQDGHYGAANRTAGVLLALAFVSLVALYGRSLRWGVTQTGGERA